MESQGPSRGVPPPADGMSAVQVAFPQSPEEFDADERVSFSKLDNKFILEADDGSQWEFDNNVGRWVPSAALTLMRQAQLDEDLIKQQTSIYANDDGGGDDSARTTALETNKRKHAEMHGEGSKKHKVAPQERENSAVYISSLPLDATEDEIFDTFSRYGMIASNVDTDKPRIKMYEDDDGNFKGDALVVYFRPESVVLAVQMLDDTDLRIGRAAASGPMRVKEADRSFKKAQDDGPSNGTSNNQKDGKALNKQGGRKGGLTSNQRKVIRHNQKMNEKLADWDDEDPQTMPQPITRNDKTVVLKHMFSLEEINGDPAVTADIEEDIREEAQATCGEVQSVTVFDREEDGVVIVKFKEAESAKKAVAKFDTRLFGGQRVEARIADGSESFRKSGTGAGNGNGQDDDDDDEITEEQRLERFGDFLEAKS